MKRMIAMCLALVLMVCSLSACKDTERKSRDRDREDDEAISGIFDFPTDDTEEITEDDEPTTEATEPTTEATEPTTEATEPTTEATEPTTEATEPTTEATEPTTEATEPTTEATEPATEATEPTVTGDWLDMQFTMDGVTYQIPFAFKELEANGWSFDPAEYGIENGYVLNPGDKTYSTIWLTNPAYSDKITMTVGFKNTSDQIQDVLDCDIWSFRIQVEYGFKLVEPHPEVVVCNGLAFGDSAEKVFEICGPCDEDYTFVSEDYGYQTYEYVVDYTYHFKVTVYDEYGITAITFEDYS